MHVDFCDNLYDFPPFLIIFSIFTLFFIHINLLHR